MNYPVWELGFGPGLLIAIVAISHVCVSHFAIGGGLFLTVTEYVAVRRDDKALLDYLKLHSKFFALLTLVYGAATGVGIWFTMGLINPAAASVLIHMYVWFWALEWIFFLIEVAAAVVYYNTWGRISQLKHFAVGAVYITSSFMSLVVINGILTFMLTPGEWTVTGNVWAAFFNETFLPSFLARCSICVLLAGVYALMTSAFVKQDATRAFLRRYSGLWALAGVLCAIPIYYWYYNQLPLDIGALMAGRLPTSLNAVNVLLVSSGLLVAASLIPVLWPRRYFFLAALVTTLLAFSFFGSSEFIRESVRKPWVISNYMYGNSIRPEEYPVIKNNGGVLPSSIWVRNRKVSINAEAGEDIFRISCRSCHSLAGYKSLVKTLNGLDKKFVQEVIPRLEYLRGQMPPFPGTLDESLALAEFLHGRTDPEVKLVSGEQVFKKRCNVCHTRDGYRALYPVLEGYKVEYLQERIPTLGTWQLKMVPYSGSKEETLMLADYIASWYDQNDQERKGE